MILSHKPTWSTSQSLGTKGVRAEHRWSSRAYSAATNRDVLRPRAADAFDWTQQIYCISFYSEAETGEWLNGSQGNNSVIFLLSFCSAVWFDSRSIIFALFHYSYQIVPHFKLLLACACILRIALRCLSVISPVRIAISAMLSRYRRST